MMTMTMNSENLVAYAPGWLARISGLSALSALQSWSSLQPRETLHIESGT